MDACLEYLLDAGRFIVEAILFNSTAAIIGSMAFLRACCILVDAESKALEAHRIIAETERRACAFANNLPTKIH